ncbi:MAG: TldD/PmbA family protein, partial [Propionibacteriaceae bacterium]
MNATVPPQDLVERALSVATLPCVLWVTEHAEANLRWANNALITNGEMRSRRLTVTATAEVADGTAAGTVTQEIAGAEDVSAVVSAAERLALAARPAEDAASMVENYAHNDVWQE